MNENPEKSILQSMLKFFSMFMISNYYRYSNITRVIIINCINCKKLVGFELKYKKLSKIITIFIVCFVSVCWFLMDCLIKGPIHVKY